MKKLILSNGAEGTHAGNITKAAETPIPQKYLLCKLNSDGTVAISGAADYPIGVATDEAEAAGDFVNVALLGASDTVKILASEAIPAGEIVVADSGGEVKALPAASGTYYQVGIALNAVNANKLVECVSCLPVQHVIS
ncbi:MAG: DUF2190 family protein [Puniceicoccales bacterium]|nr:DUF2190 family protein [Puniceicoccales bacterium]